MSEQVLPGSEVRRRRYPPLSISLPFLAVGALPIMTTCQRAVRGSPAAVQPHSRRSERFVLFPPPLSVPPLFKSSCNRYHALT